MSSMIARLHETTQTHHTAADADFDILFEPRTTVDHYRTFLTHMYGFEAPLEMMLVRTPNLDRMLDLQERSKAPLLVADLFALGVRPVELAAIPQCLAIPQFRGVAEALGWMYVTERASLVHSVVRRHLQTRLSTRLKGAAAYLGAYDGIAGGRWRAFGVVLDSVAREPVIADRIIAAASEAFRTQRRWINQELPLLARAVG